MIWPGTVRRCWRSGVVSSTEARARWAWLSVLALLVLPSLLLGGADPLAQKVLAWDPALVWAEPWRCWSAAWVHLSRLHLEANLLGALLVGALGWVARVPLPAAWAWALAWPLTHLALLVQPQLQRYGGLSGVLHAGVAVVVVALLMRGPDGRTRAVAALLGAGLAAKILIERPWDHVLSHPAGWDIAVAPMSHAAGALAGVACCAACLLASRTRAP